jgi:hypothetical protein
MISTASAHSRDSTPTPLAYTTAEQRLLDRLHNDRYDATAPSEGVDDRDFRRWHNAGIDHAIEIVETWLCERVMERQSRRLCERHDAAYAQVERSIRASFSLDDNGLHELLMAAEVEVAV